MQPRALALLVLKGPTVSRIRFTFPSRHRGPITVNGTSYRLVASQIEKGTRWFGTKTDPALAGSYNQTFNEFKFDPDVSGRDDEQTIVHESTHAFFDICKIHITANEDEAACYTAGMLYLRMTGFPMSRMASEAIFKAAFGVADKLLHEYQLGRTALPVVDPAAWSLLKSAIMFTPGYNRPGMAGYQAGFLGRLLGREYNNNG